MKIVKILFAALIAAQLTACKPEPTQENFLKAINDGNVSDLRDIHEQGYQSLKQNEESVNTAFQVAFEAKKAGVAKFLIDNNYPAQIDKAQLFESVIANSQGFVKLILDQGVDVNAKNDEGIAAIHLAVNTEQSSPSMIKLLVEKGADIESRLSSGATPLMLASEKNNLVAVKQLLKSGAELHGEDKSKFTALNLAVKGGAVDVIEVLVNAGINIDHKDIDGDTALSLAAILNQPKALKKLIDLGADVNSENGEGQTPIMLAILKSGSVEMTNFLIAAKADLNKQDDDGFSALHMAIGNRNNTDESQFKIAELLINNGVNPDATTNKGYTALMFASAFNKSIYISLVIDKSLNLNKLNQQEKLFALDYARSNSNWEVASLLEQAGARSAYEHLFPAKPAPRNGYITCNTNCRNGNCFRTYSDGRKVNFQAKRKYNMFNSMWEWDSGSC